MVGTAYEIIAIEIPKFLRNRDETHDEAIPTTVDEKAPNNGSAYKLREKNEAPPAYSEKVVDIETTKTKDMEQKGNKNTEEKKSMNWI